MPRVNIHRRYFNNNSLLSKLIFIGITAVLGFLAGWIISGASSR